MRKEDLREATKRAAERDGHKLKTRLSQGEKRKATVAEVYSVERQMRTPGSILGVEGQKEEAGDTDAYWTFHKTEELKRNDLSRMASHYFGRVTVLKEPHSFLFRLPLILRAYYARSQTALFDSLTLALSRRERGSKETLYDRG